LGTDAKSNPGEPAAERSQKYIGAWNGFVALIRKKYGEGPVSLREEMPRFTAFTRMIPQTALSVLLFHAYDRYRTLDIYSKENFIESSCCSILISTILSADPIFTKEEALGILKRAHHYCGHGGDVRPPLEFALRFYTNRLYDGELFDAVSCYRDTLRKIHAAAAINTRRQLIWILWHDPRRTERAYHTRHIQLALHSMPVSQRTPWQLLFRHNSFALGPKAGKEWLRTAGKLVQQIGTDDFVDHIDNWFTFPEGEEIGVSNVGYAMLRTLIWCGAAMPDGRVRPILLRLKTVRWKKSSQGVGRKLLAALKCVESK
jgi:hypothetical protein